MEWIISPSKFTSPLSFNSLSGIIALLDNTLGNPEPSLIAPAPLPAVATTCRFHLGDGFCILPTSLIMWSPTDAQSPGQLCLPGSRVTLSTTFLKISSGYITLFSQSRWTLVTCRIQFNIYPHPSFGLHKITLSKSTCTSRLMFLSAALVCISLPFLCYCLHLPLSVKVRAHAISLLVFALVP